MISRETIEKILDTADIVEVVSQFVSLKKEGATFKGLSPFQSEKTPSFFVVPSKGIYKCFSSGKGGNVVDFLMEKERLTFPEALRWLGEKYQIEVESSKKENKAERTERETLLDSFAALQKKFAAAFVGSPADVYMVDRGFGADICEQFGVGYCIPGAHHQMSGRVTFPIRNVSGKVIAFGGRSLDGTMPKYTNSPESGIYSKSKTLYALHAAKDEMVKSGMVYLVEGYTDVMRMHSVGLQNTVSSSGTALTVDQVAILKRYCGVLILVLDGDMAGIKAAQRGIDIALEAGMEVQLKLLPKGDDPDDFIRRKGRHAFENLACMNFIEYKISTLMAISENDKSKRSACIRSACASISRVQDPALREMYMREVCAKFFISYDVVRQYITHPELGADQKVNREELRHQWETDLARLLFQHGADTISIEYGGKLEPVIVSEYVVASLMSDGILPQCPEVSYLLQQIDAKMNDGKLLSETDVAMDERLRALRNEVVTLDDGSAVDPEALKVSARDLVQYVKMWWVNQEIALLDEQLSKTSTGDFTALLSRKQELIDFRMRLSGLNGRAVV